MRPFPHVQKIPKKTFKGWFFSLLLHKAGLNINPIHRAVIGVFGQIIDRYPIRYAFVLFTQPKLHMNQLLKKVYVAFLVDNVQKAFQILGKNTILKCED